MLKHNTLKKETERKGPTEKERLEIASLSYTFIVYR